MTHDPEEIKAVADKIGKLYGYNVEAIARNVLDVLRPFRDRELLTGGARHERPTPPTHVFDTTHRVWVDDTGYHAQTTLLNDIYRDIAADIEAARAAHHAEGRDHFPVDKVSGAPSTLAKLRGDE